MLPVWSRSLVCTILFEFHGPQNLKQIVEIIGPRAQIWRHGDRLDEYGGIDGVEKMAAARDHHPVGRVDQFAVIVVVYNQPRVAACFRGQKLHHRRQIQVCVGRVDGEYAVRLQVAQVHRESFARQKVHGNGVAGKVVDRQYIELLRRFILQREARVSQDNVDSRRRIAQVTEGSTRDGDNLRIDFVEAEVVAGLAIRRQRAPAQANRADALRVGATVRQRQSDAGIRSIVRGGQETRWRVDVLRAVLDLAVIQRAVRLLEPVRELPHAQRAIKAAYAHDGVLFVSAHIAHQHKGHGRRRGNPENAHQPPLRPQRHDGQQSREDQRQRKFVDRGEQVRSGKPDKNRAEGAAKGNHEIEGGGVAGRRPPKRQLAVAKPAAQKESDAKNRHADLHRFRVRRVIDRVAQAAQRNGEKANQWPAPIKDALAERERERQQVQGQRQDPEQRNRRHVFQ